MIKIIISAYIAAVLLFAGFAEANVGPRAEASTNLDMNTIATFQRLDEAKVYLNVQDAQFDSSKEILTLSGQVSPECLSSIKPVLSIDQNQVLVSVVAQGKDCMSQDGSFDVAIDLKAFFADRGLDQDTSLQFVIDNYSGTKNASFVYEAKQQVKYSFDTVLDGKIEMNKANGKFYLTHGRTKIQILSRLDLSSYVNRFVQLKGLIPANITIGDDASVMASQLIVGQLIALR